MRDGIAEAVSHSLHTVFLVATPIALLGFAVVLLLREVPLRGPGGPPAGKAADTPAARRVTAGAAR